MNLQKLSLSFDKIPSLKILVLGDVMVDMYDFCYTSSSRPSPEKKDKLVYTTHKTIKTLGGAGNVAANLSALGVKTSLISVAGNDGHCLTLQKLAEDAGILHAIIKDESRPTTTKFRLYIDDDYILRRDDEKCNEIDEGVENKIFVEFIKQINDIDAVIISDYNKGFFTKHNAQKIIEQCNLLNVPVIVDFKPSNCGYFENADIIAPNELEAKELLAGFNDCGNLKSDILTLYKKLNCKNIVVTLGRKGICGFDGCNFFKLPAFEVVAVDVVGCGDTVRCCLAVACCLGLELKECAELANAAASVVVTKTGTATLNLQELNFIIK